MKLFRPLRLMLFLVVALGFSPAHAETFPIEATALADAAGGSSQRKLVRTSNGDFHTVFHKNDLQSVRQIYYGRSSDNGETWAISALTNDNSGHQNRPSIAVDSENTLHVVWWGRHAGSVGVDQIRYIKFDGSWSAISNLTAENFTQEYSVLAVDSSDNLHLTWHGRDDNSAVTQIRYMKFVNSWGGITNLTNEAYGQTRPSIAIDSADSVHLVWWGRDDISPATDQIRYIKHTNSWSAITNLTSGVLHQNYPVLGVDSQDNVHVVWRGLVIANAIYQIRYIKYDGNWGAIENLTAEASNQWNPTISFDSEDQAYVFWNGNAPYKIRYSTYTNQWSAAASLVDTGAVVNQHPIPFGAIHPTINGVRTNFPKNGYAFVWVSGTAFNFLRSNDLQWETPIVEDYLWTGHGDGTSWEDEDNWDAGWGYPNSNEHTATINVGNDAITTAGPISVGQYVQGGAFSGSLSLGDDFVVDDAQGENGNFTVASGTFDTNNSPLSVDGDVAVSASLLLRASAVTVRGNIDLDSASLVSATSTVTLSPLNGNRSISSDGNDFYNLILDAQTNNSVFTLDGALEVTGRLTVTRGTLSFGNDNVTVNDVADTGIAIAVGANGALYNAGTGDLFLGGGVSNAGAILFNSSENAEDGITIASTQVAQTREWSGTGSFNLSDVTVSDQETDGTTLRYLIANSSTNDGRNAKWIFPGATLNSAAITLSSYARQASSDAVLSFELINSLPADGKIKVEFPVSFDLSNVSAVSSANINGGLNYSVNGRVVTIQRAGGSMLSAGATISDLRIESLINPSQAGSSGEISISTLTADNIAIDSRSLSGVNIVPNAADIGLTFSGTVKISNISNDPLPGVQVTAGAVSATTNKRGEFVLRGVALGTSRISAVKAGYTFVLQNFTNQLGQSSTISNIRFIATPQLSKKVYGGWNGFLNGINIFEVLNRSETKVLTLKLEVINTSNRELDNAQRIISVAPGQQVDVIINDLPNFEKDSVGLIGVEASHRDFDGRISTYRVSGTSFEFAYAAQLTENIRGRSAVTINTNHPNGSVNLENAKVNTWLALANLHPTKARSFSVRRYSYDGVTIDERKFRLAPLQRIDVEAGHVVPGDSSTGLIEIRPKDEDSQYYAQLVRYAVGSDGSHFDFAVGLPALSGSLSSNIHAIISSNFNGINYIEIANVTDSRQTFKVVLSRADGSIALSESHTLPPYGQLHFRADSLLGEDEVGVATIKSSKRGAIIGHSLFYYQNVTNALVTAVDSSAFEGAFGRSVLASFNLNLGMTNLLRLGNVSGSQVEVSLRLAGSNFSHNLDTITLEPYSATVVSVGEQMNQAQSNDLYGLIDINSSKQGAVIAEVVRIKKTEQQDYEFGLNTAAR